MSIGAPKRQLGAKVPKIRKEEYRTYAELDLFSNN